MARIFPDFVEGVIRVVGDHSRAPQIYTRWAAMSIIAGALGRKYWYDAGSYQIRPNLFIMLVGGPGAGKGTSLIIPYEHIYRGLANRPGVRSDQEGYNPAVESFGLDDAPPYIIWSRVTPERLGVDIRSCQHVDPFLSTPTG